MLSRPGLEDILVRGLKSHNSEVLLDIGDGSRLQTLLGLDCKAFLDSPSNELRLMWTIAIDWFNPYYNKAAGKSASIGSVTLVCLNLPLSLQYKPENLYLAGILPGPREPDYNQINHFLNPIIQRFLVLWRDGSWFTRTVQCPRGRLSRSAIAGLVCDLLGSRKVSRHVHHSMHWFCSWCLLTRDSINNTASDTWV